MALIGEDKRPVLWQKLLTEASLADYQAKVERLIAASQRCPGMTFLMPSVARCEPRSISHSAYGFMTVIAVEWV